MEAQRATDNIQQKASDCLGTVNEKPYTLAQRMIDQNEMFKNVRSKPLDVWAERLARKYTKFECGGIVNPKGCSKFVLPTEERIFLNGVYLGPPESVSIDLTDPDLFAKINAWKNRPRFSERYFNDNPKKD